MRDYTYLKTPEWKLRYIRINHADHTAREMAELLEVSECHVRAYCKQQGIKPKPSTWHKANRPQGMVVKGTNPNPGYRYPKTQPVRTRPPAVYSNVRAIDKYLTD